MTELNFVLGKIYYGEIVKKMYNPIDIKILFVI